MEAGTGFRELVIQTYEGLGFMSLLRIRTSFRSEVRVAMEAGTGSVRPVSSSLRSAGSAPKLSSPSHVFSSSFSRPGEDSCSAASATCGAGAGSGPRLAREGRTMGRQLEKHADLGSAEG